MCSMNDTPYKAACKYILPDDEHKMFVIYRRQDNTSFANKN